MYIVLRGQPATTHNSTSHFAVEEVPGALYHDAPGGVRFLLLYEVKPFWLRSLSGLQIKSNHGNSSDLFLFFTLAGGARRSTMSPLSAVVLVAVASARHPLLVVFLTLFHLLEPPAAPRCLLRILEETVVLRMVGLAAVAATQLLLFAAITIAMIGLLLALGLLALGAVAPQMLVALAVVAQLLSPDAHGSSRLRLLLFLALPPQGTAMSWALKGGRGTAS